MVAVTGERRCASVEASPRARACGFAQGDASAFIPDAISPGSFDEFQLPHCAEIAPPGERRHTRHVAANDALSPFDFSPPAQRRSCTAAVSVCAARGTPTAACTCAALKQAGRCGDLAPAGAWLSTSGGSSGSSTSSFSALAARAGGLCAVTCGRCQANAPRCMDQRVPRQLARSLGAPEAVAAEAQLSAGPAPDGESRLVISGREGGV